MTREQFIKRLKHNGYMVIRFASSVCAEIGGEMCQLPEHEDYAGCPIPRNPKLESRRALRALRRQCKRNPTLSHELFMPNGRRLQPKRLEDAGVVVQEYEGWTDSKGARKFIPWREWGRKVNGCLSIERSI